jgi:uncharacterized protein YecE (DUF72 family)
MLRIGTSGWQYLHWKGRFYPSGLASDEWLHFYSAQFTTVEVNNTFYRLPARATFADWRDRVPDDFEFSIKASNYLTHYKRLREPDEPVERLLQRAAAMRPKLAVVLLQLPPNLPCAPERLDATLSAFGGRTRVAVEMRHASWFCDEVRDILAEHDAALCLADRGSRVVTPLWQTAQWIYLRLHAGRAPSSCYGRRALRSWARRIVDYFGTAATGYIYFNNDAHGCAVHDAHAFAASLATAGLTVSRTRDAPPLRA